MTLPKINQEPESRPHPINLVMTPMEDAGGIEIGIIFNGRSEPEYLNYVQGFYDAPFYFYFDVRGDALIIVVRWGSGKASRWAWGHVSPHDWAKDRQLDGPIHPNKCRPLYVAVGGEKLEPMGRVLELPAHYYNPLQRVLAELYTRPWTWPGYYNELNAWVASREAKQLASMETGENLSLERCLVINAKYGGRLHDERPDSFL